MTDEEVGAIKQVAGVDATGMSHTLNANEIRHLRKQHGPGSADTHPLTDADIQRIPEVLDGWDYIEQGTPKQGLPSVRFVKRINGNLFVVERVFPTSKDNTPRLSVVTAWKEPSTGSPAEPVSNRTRYARSAGKAQSEATPIASNVNPVVPSALKQEVRTPEPAKQAAGFNAPAAREQKKFLLHEIDKAIAGAPDAETMEGEQKAAYERAVELRGRQLYGQGVSKQEYSTPEEALKAERYRVEEDAVNEEVARQGYPHITIEVPGDGTFTILHERGALERFKKRAEKFPTSAPLPDATTRKRAPSPEKPPAVGVADKEGVLQAAGLFVSSDPKREVLHSVWSDGKQTVATTGRTMIVVNKGVGGSEKAPRTFTPDGRQTKHKDNFPNWKQAVPNDTLPVARGVDAARLWTVLRQSTEATTDQRSSVAIMLNKDGSLGVRADSEGLGYNHNAPEGAPVLLHVNPHYLMDALAAAMRLGNAKVDIETTFDRGTHTPGDSSIHRSGAAPIMVKTGNMLAVVMPMRPQRGFENGVSKLDVMAITDPAGARAEAEALLKRVERFGEKHTSAASDAAELRKWLGLPEAAATAEAREQKPEVSVPTWMRQLSDEELATKIKQLLSNASARNAEKGELTAQTRRAKQKFQTTTAEKKISEINDESNKIWTEGQGPELTTEKDRRFKEKLNQRDTTPPPAPVKGETWTQPPLMETQRQTKGLEAQRAQLVRLIGETERAAQKSDEPTTADARLALLESKLADVEKQLLAARKEAAARQTEELRGGTTEDRRPTTETLPGPPSTVAPTKPTLPAGYTLKKVEGGYFVYKKGKDGKTAVGDPLGFKPNGEQGKDAAIQVAVDDAARAEKRAAVKQVQAMADKRYGKGEVNVVDEENIPPDVKRQAAEQRANPRAFYLGRDGKIYLVLDNIPKVDREGRPWTMEEALTNSFQHELIHGLKDVIGEERFNRFLQRVRDQLPAAHLKFLADRYKLNPDTPKGIEEIAARVGEDVDMSSKGVLRDAWRRIVAAVREAWHRLFGNRFRKMTLTDNDVRQMLRTAREGMAEVRERKAAEAARGAEVGSWELGEGARFQTDANRGYV
ncbi:MAG: hypothetical protein NTY01_00265 [Verrucomicrobia bacterium]|nr:hypothetical protein [Verrucomicrobiota bacterium]